MYGTLTASLKYFFSRLLAHHKIVITENLKKRGIEGPSCCILCKNEEETQKNIFLYYSYANEVWCLALKELHFNITLLTNWKDFFACSEDYYHGTLFKKQHFTRAWLVLPKYVCWKIWISRNKAFVWKPKSISSYSLLLCQSTTDRSSSIQWITTLTSWAIKLHWENMD